MSDKHLISQFWTDLSELLHRYAPYEEWERWHAHQISRGRAVVPFRLLEDWQSVTDAFLGEMLEENAIAKKKRPDKRRFYDKDVRSPLTGAHPEALKHALQWLREECAEAEQSAGSNSGYVDALQDATGVFVIVCRLLFPEMPSFLSSLAVTASRLSASHALSPTDGREFKVGPEEDEEEERYDDAGT